MKIAVLSDLHLAPGGANRCTATSAELLSLFDRIEARASRVVVAGDIFDLDRPRLPGDWREQLARLRRERPEVMRRLDAYDWILGNHDAALCRRGVPEERCFVADGVRVLVRHGHQWDMPLKKVPGLATSANFVAGWLERSGLRGAARAMGRVPLVLDRMLSRRDRHRNHRRAGPPSSPDRCLNGARELLAAENWDVVVCGHSHRLRLVADPHGLFVNTGSLCLGHLDWALIETDAPQPRVTTYRDFEAVEHAVLGGGGWQIEPFQ
jgi:predicted phosphodiesterase